MSTVSLPNLASSMPVRRRTSLETYALNRFSIWRFGVASYDVTFIMLFTSCWNVSRGASPETASSTNLEEVADQYMFCLNLSPVLPASSNSWSIVLMWENTVVALVQRPVSPFILGD